MQNQFKVVESLDSGININLCHSYDNFTISDEFIDVFVLHALVKKSKASTIKKILKECLELDTFRGLTKKELYSLYVTRFARYTDGFEYDENKALNKRIYDLAVA